MKKNFLYISTTAFELQFAPACHLFFFLEVQLHYNFLRIFLNYRKIWFHINGVNNYFIILCIFPNISFWRQSIFFPSFFCDQNRLGFLKILEIKLSDQSIVSKKGWRETKESRRLNFCKASNGLSSQLPAILIFLNSWNKTNTGVQYFLFPSVKQPSDE